MDRAGGQGGFRHAATRDRGRRHPLPRRRGGLRHAGHRGRSAHRHLAGASAPSGAPATLPPLPAKPRATPSRRDHHGRRRTAAPPPPAAPPARHHRRRGGTTTGGAKGPATGAPILLGAVGTKSGLIGTALAGGFRGLTVWEKWVNANGGVQGRPVKIIQVDDAGDPGKHAAAVRKLIREDGVVAFIGNIAPFTLSAGLPLLEEAQIPAIGGDGGDSSWFHSPIAFRSTARRWPAPGRRPSGPSSTSPSARRRVYVSEAEASIGAGPELRRRVAEARWPGRDGRRRVAGHARLHGRGRAGPEQRRRHHVRRCSRRRPATATSTPRSARATRR